LEEEEQENFSSSGAIEDPVLFRLHDSCR
jgi:hypothetical protein